MKAENKTLASIGGVAVLAAVVIGGSLAAATHSGGTTPAGNQVPGPAMTSSTATSSAAVASPTSVAPSTKQAAAPKRAAVVTPGDPVTTPVPDPGTSDASQPPNQDLGSGTVDDGGVRRAPVATTHAPHPSHPDEGEIPPPPPVSP